MRVMRSHQGGERVWADVNHANIKLAARRHVDWTTRSDIRLYTTKHKVPYLQKSRLAVYVGGALHLEVPSSPSPLLNLKDEVLLFSALALMHQPSPSFPPRVISVLSGETQDE